MTSKVYYKILLILLISNQTILSQDILSGYILDIQTNETISGVKVYSNSRGLVDISDENGYYSFEATKVEIISFYMENYLVNQRLLNQNETIYLEPLIENLDEIQIIARNEKIFSLQ